MKNVNLAIREAFVSALSVLPYSGVNVPVHEEFVQYTKSKPKAFITVGSDQVEVYVLILNQTSNDQSPKCGRNDATSIQVQICAVFPDNKGGSKTPEQISEVIMSTLFSDNHSTNLTLPAPFHLWKSDLETTVNMQFDTDTNRIWCVQLIFSNYVSQ